LFEQMLRAHGDENKGEGTGSSRPQGVTAEMTGVDLEARRGNRYVEQVCVP